MRLHCDEATARSVADMIVETFDPAETAAAAFEQEPNTRDWSSGPWMVEVWFAEAPDEALIRELVAGVTNEDTARQLVFDVTAQRDWVAASLEGLAPVRAGRFLVHGSHDRGRVRSNDIGLEIEAALAFGTGHHGTTRGCLIMLDRILKRRRPRCILDVGAGTGVLALAAARALRTTVAAGDIDPIAVAAARANAKLNGAAPWVAPVVARGVRHPLLHRRRHYDLVFANILAKPLRLLAPSIAEVAAPRADIVLSGLLARDVRGVLSAYGAQGFALADRIDLDGWASLVIRRRGASPAPKRS
jgi:ribosomal protein L11 methyltransferase